MRQKTSSPLDEFELRLADQMTPTELDEWMSTLEGAELRMLGEYTMRILDERMDRAAEACRRARRMLVVEDPTPRSRPSRGPEGCEEI